MKAPETPTDLGKRSWFGTRKRVVSEFRDDNLTDWAAALTYYAVLSIFPALIALISILGLSSTRQTITRVVTDIVRQLGPEAAVTRSRADRADLREPVDRASSA